MKHAHLVTAVLLLGASGAARRRLTKDAHRRREDLERIYNRDDAVDRLKQLIQDNTR